MTNDEASSIFRTLKNHKVYGGRNWISPPGIEGDKRKRNKAIRELVAGGWLSNDNDELKATDKLWNETPMQGVDLKAEWEASRADSRWNTQRQLDFVRLTQLTDGQVRNVVECAGHYDWYVCFQNPIVYNTAMIDGDLHGPVENPDVNLGEKVGELVKGDTFDSQEVAEDFASELFHFYKYRETVVTDKDGNTVKRFERMAGAGNKPRKRGK